MGVTARTTGDAAGTLRSLAVLLTAGGGPSSSWRHLADSGDAVAERIVARFDEGTPIVPAIAAERTGDAAWGDVAAAWEVAATVGAPLADTLRSVADALRDAVEVRDDIRVALAEPAASARLMLWLPLLGVVVSAGLGLDTFSVLFGTTAGIVCLVGGILLVACARVWTTRLVRRAQPPDGTPGMHEELLASALSGGVAAARADEVLTACEEWSDSIGTDTAEVDRVLALSRASGVPAVELLRAAAAHARHRARTAGRLAGARLGSRLLLPMGLCSLPAFLLLGVAPMLLSVVAATPLPTFAG